MTAANDMDPGVASSFTAIKHDGRAVFGRSTRTYADQKGASPSVLIYRLLLDYASKYRQIL